MKRFLCPLLIFVLSLVVNLAEAQIRIQVGATTAVNSTFVLDKGLSEDPRFNSKATYKWSPIGFALGFDFGKVGLSLESIYAKQGQIYNIIDVAEKAIGDRKIDLEYIQLPLLLNFLGHSNSQARFNVMIGPQLSLLTKGIETYQQFQAGTLTLPEGVDSPPTYADPGSYNSQTRTYTVSNTNAITLANDVGGAQIRKFSELEFQVAGGIGLSIDLSDKFMLTTQIRSSYSINDTRNSDFVSSVKSGTTRDLFGKRSNLVIGVQLGFHYVFGGTRFGDR